MQMWPAYHLVKNDSGLRSSYCLNFFHSQKECEELYLLNKGKTVCGGTIKKYESVEEWAKDL